VFYLSDEKKDPPNTIATFFAHNMVLVFMVLSLPAVGMIGAMGLIIYLSPKNLQIIIALIFFLLIQYLVLLVYIKGRINKIIKN
jgi:hypothetical protein